MPLHEDLSAAVPRNEAQRARIARGGRRHARQLRPRRALRTRATSRSNSRTTKSSATTSYPAYGPCFRWFSCSSSSARYVPSTSCSGRSDWCPTRRCAQVLCPASRCGSVGVRSGCAGLRIPDLARGKGGATDRSERGKPVESPRGFWLISNTAAPCLPGFSSFSSSFFPWAHGPQCALGSPYTRHAGGACSCSVQEVRFLRAPAPSDGRGKNFGRCNFVTGCGLEPDCGRFRLAAEVEGRRGREARSATDSA